MSGWWPLAAVTVLYLAQAWQYGAALRPPMALVFIGYAIANVGLIWDYVAYER